MVNAILGKKLGMTQIFMENGDVVPATVLKAGPCIVVQRKTRAWGRAADTPLVAKLAGLAELLLWLSVVTAAVEIPNF